MASRPVVLRPQLAHILPLCSSAFSLGMTALQFPLFFAFLSATPPMTGRPLSSFWTAFLPRSIGFILAPLLVSAGSGYLAARSLAGSPSALWYRCGSAAALGHLAYGYMAAVRIGAIVERAHGQPGSERDIGDRNSATQASWLRVHAVRTLTVDLPAFFFFFRGFGEAFM